MATNDFKKNVNEYSSQIKTIKNFAEAVRKTPGQYIGYIGNKGHINMIREVLQNSMDELQKDDSPCDHISVEYYEADRRFVCSDNGRGIPFDNMHRIFAEEHTSSNYVKKPGEFSSGRHGVGAKVTNALSHEFVVQSYICKEYSPDGKAHGRTISFAEGKCTSKGKNGEVNIPNKNNYQGSMVWFTPSNQIMGIITTTCDDVLSLVSTLLPLMKIGAVIEFHGVTIDGQVIDRHMVNEDGIKTFLIYKEPKNMLIYPIEFHALSEDGRLKADIALSWVSGALDRPEDIVSFANMCPTINQSSHVTGFLDAVCNYFRLYMNKIFLPKNSKVTIQNSDIRAGMLAAVSVFHIEPMFSGQAKEIFSNKDIIPFERDIIKAGLDDWTKKNSTDVQRLCKFFKDVATLRNKSDNEKITLLKKSVSTLSGLPSKYMKPTGKSHLELILVEGDSAASPCGTGRDPTRQGIFPLRGKVKNAMCCSKSEFFKNEECKAIWAILGCGEGKNCDPKKCKFEKIIFLGDADMDGLHIRSLLLKMFLVYYRPLVEAGMVYAAVPPLYSIKKKGGDLQFFTNRGDYVKYVYSIFSKSNEVSNSNKKKMTSKELVDILQFNYNYLDDMYIVSTNYSVDPELLEMVYGMIVRNISPSKIKKSVQKYYPFLDVKYDNHILVLDGLVGEQIQTAVFNENMLNDCERRIGKYVRNMDPNGYIINKTKVSLYQLMKIFHSYTPSAVQRYKGLGEMKARELAVSTLDPNYGRTLIRYTSENIEREVAEIRRIDSNMKDLLEDVDIAGFEI